MALVGMNWPSSCLPTFISLTILATLSQLFEVVAPNRQSYYATLVFFFAGVFLLPPGLFVFLVSIPHLVELAKARITRSGRLRAWYIQPFNIITHILAGAGARLAYNALNVNADGLIRVSPVLAAAAAAIVYVVINHLLIGQALRLARGVSWRESGILDPENLVSDLALLCLGYIVSVLWAINPWLSIPAFSPLILMYRALMIPRLKQEAQRDDKTGLWNARYFAKSFTAEMERAKRFGRPLAFIMADLDLLRTINNTHGHLAGDAVLAGVGKIIRESVREYDIAGRFGGEEFAIVLPETSMVGARAVAERIRRAVESATFTAPTSSEQIHVTISMGIACFPEDARTAKELLHEADLAMYQVKLKGRNGIMYAKDVPHFAKLDRAALEGYSQNKYTEIFGEAIGQEPAPGQPAPDSGQSRARPETLPIFRQYPKTWMIILIAGVVLAACAVTLVGAFRGPLPNLDTIGLLVILAVVAELLQLENVSGDTSVSVSVAVNFAAGLIAGIPGIVFVSATIALIHRLRFRPHLYKTAFNWAVHIMAGTAPVITVSLLGIPLTAAQIPVLLIPVTLAAATYYLIETGLIAIAISLSEGSEVLPTWGEQFRWLASHYIVLCVMGLFLAIAHVAMGALGALVFAMPVFMMRYVQKQYVERTESSVRELKRMNHELVFANHEIDIASRAIRQLNDELFLTLAKIIDARDPYIAGHAAKVGEYATTLAMELRLPAERVALVRQAAFLHDIGKMGISEKVLQKPARLTPEEYALVKKHASLGADFLETCQSLRPLVPFVRYHHEWWNGQGYDGLRGEQAPLEARILAVCDAIDAMASDRPYHRAKPFDEIISEVKRCSGTQFDPQVVEAFLQIAEREGADLFTTSTWDIVGQIPGTRFDADYARAR
jgi:diguanylate cyclase (GGDEF)-like protein/putative nucleotidyltransferase with HDIG domain